MPGFSRLFSLQWLGQPPQATIRVEVTAESLPAEAADVTINGKSVRTGSDGFSTIVAAAGDLKITVTKERILSLKRLTRGGRRTGFPRASGVQPRKAVEEEIRVYATRNDVQVQDSPLYVEVLQRDEVDEKMLMTPGDIVMMLNEMGGMRVQTTSPSLGAASVRVQGMRGRYTSFLSDGLPLFGQQGAGLGLLQVPPMDLGQVEVIKGNASGIKVNAMCPGWVRTRMGGEGAARSPDEGADTAIWLATLHDDGPTGRFFRDRKPLLKTPRAILAAARSSARGTGPAECHLGQYCWRRPARFWGCAPATHALQHGRRARRFRGGTCATR